MGSPSIRPSQKALTFFGPAIQVVLGMSEPRGADSEGSQASVQNEAWIQKTLTFEGFPIMSFREGSGKVSRVRLNLLYGN